MTEIRAYVIVREYDLFVTIFDVSTARNYFSVCIWDWKELLRMFNMFNVQRLTVSKKENQ